MFGRGKLHFGGAINVSISGTFSFWNFLKDTPKLLYWKRFKLTFGNKILGYQIVH